MDDVLIMIHDNDKDNEYAEDNDDDVGSHIMMNYDNKEYNENDDIMMKMIM